MLKTGSFLFVTLIALLAASCAPAIPTTSAPIMTEEPSIPVTGSVVVQSLDVQVMGSNPPQVNAILRGRLPDSGCTTISSIDQTRQGNTINLTLNPVSTTDPAVSCMVVDTPFEKVVGLDISSLPPGSYTVRVNDLEKSFDLPAPTVEQFRQLLVDALNARDYQKMKTLMDASFLIAYWQSEGTSNPPDQAIAVLQRNQLVTLPIAADPNKDFAALLRSDPVSVGAVEASFACANMNAEFCVRLAGQNGSAVEASPLFTSGWGSQGKDEAILFIAKRADGSLYWHGLLFAKDGFMKPDPVVATPVVATPVDTKAYATQVPYILALQDVRMRTGPGLQFNIIGFVAAGQTAKVTGVNANGTWWRVVCPDGSVGNCWVSALASLTQPSNSPAPDTSPYPTNIKYVKALKDVNISIGPGTQFPIVGMVRAGETVQVLGVNVDKRWWQVPCLSNDVTCWISADPSLTVPTDLPRLADVQSVEVQILASTVVQANAIARGMLPDAGCTVISGATQSRSGNTITVTLSVKKNPQTLCAQMLTPFEYVIPLDVSSLLPGRYNVNVNGVVTSFELPGPVTYP